MNGRITVSTAADLSSAQDMAPIDFDEETGVYEDLVLPARSIYVRLLVRDAPRNDNGDLLAVTSLEWIVNGEHHTTDTAPGVNPDPDQWALAATVELPVEPGPLTVTARVVLADGTTTDIAGDCVIE